MDSFGATQLCWVILGFLLLQGASNSLTTEPVSPNTGDVPASEPNSPSPLSSTGIPEPPKKASQVPMVTSKPTTPGSSTMDGHSSSSLGLPQSQPQKHTLGLDTTQNITPKSTTTNLRTGDYLTIVPSPTSESVLTVAAFGVISFIVILVVVVIVLVSVVSLRFKCRKNKEPEDPQKPGSSGISESCSTANGEKDSITLISMKNINMNNSIGCSTEKVL